MNINEERKKYLTGGLAGFDNIGNTCYMNASLQNIMGTEIFAAFFFKQYYKDDLERNVCEEIKRQKIANIQPVQVEEKSAYENIKRRLVAEGFEVNGTTGSGYRKKIEEEIQEHVSNVFELKGYDKEKQDQLNIKYNVGKRIDAELRGLNKITIMTVSYTHLTLPTKRIV